MLLTTWMIFDLYCCIHFHFTHSQRKVPQQALAYDHRIRRPNLQLIFQANVLTCQEAAQLQVNATVLLDVTSKLHAVLLAINKIALAIVIGKAHVKIQSHPVQHYL